MPSPRAVTVGGFSAKGQAASVQKNQVTVGRGRGATVEHEARGEVLCNGTVRMCSGTRPLTPGAIARVVKRLAARQGLALDAGTVQVEGSAALQGFVVAFLGDLGNLRWNRTSGAGGSSTSGRGPSSPEKRQDQHRRHRTRNLACITRETPLVSQPEPSQGKTRRRARTDVGITEEGGRIHFAPRTIDVGELRRVLNRWV